MGHMDAYEGDFEAYMLGDSGEYYSRKASNWILEDSCPDYMLKVSVWFRYAYGCGVAYQVSSCLNLLWNCTGRGMLEKGEGKSFSLPSFK